MGVAGVTQDLVFWNLYPAGGITASWLGWMSSHSSVSVLFTVLETFVDSSVGSCIYGPGPLILTLLQTEIGPVSGQKRLQAHVPSAVRAVAPARALQPLSTSTAQSREDASMWTRRVPASVSGVQSPRTSSRVSAVPKVGPDHTLKTTDPEYSWPLISSSVNWTHPSIHRLFPGKRSTAL